MEPSEHARPKHVRDIANDFFHAALERQDSANPTADPLIKLLPDKGTDEGGDQQKPHKVEGEEGDANREQNKALDDYVDVEQGAEKELDLRSFASAAG